MIERITNKDRIPDVLKMARNIRVWDFDITELGLFLELNTNNPAVLLLADTDNNGFCLASIYRDLVIPYVVIMFSWVSPKHPEISREIWEKVKEWTRENGLTTIRILVKKNVKGFMKKYGFSQEGIMLKMEV